MPPDVHRRERKHALFQLQHSPHRHERGHMFCAGSNSLSGQQSANIFFNGDDTCLPEHVEYLYYCGLQIYIHSFPHLVQLETDCGLSVSHSNHTRTIWAVYSLWLSPFCKVEALPHFFPKQSSEIQEEAALYLASKYERVPLSLSAIGRDVQTAYIGPLGNGPALTDYPPIILLHGFDGSSLEFRRLKPLLAEKAQTWAVDLVRDMLR